MRPEGPSSMVDSMPNQPTAPTDADRDASPSLLRRLGSIAGLRLLDVGCGRGALLAAATAQGADVWGVDSSAELLDDARRRVPRADVRLACADDLPFDSG